MPSNIFPYFWEAWCHLYFQSIDDEFLFLFSFLLLVLLRSSLPYPPTSHHVLKFHVDVYWCGSSAIYCAEQPVGLFSLENHILNSVVYFLISFITFFHCLLFSFPYLYEISILQMLGFIDISSKSLIISPFYFSSFLFTFSLLRLIFFITILHTVKCTGLKCVIWWVLTMA